MSRRFRPYQYRVVSDVQDDQRSHHDRSRQGGALDHFPRGLPAGIRNSAGTLHQLIQLHQ
jgi:hypothetical protein